MFRRSQPHEVGPREMAGLQAFEGSAVRLRAKHQERLRKLEIPKWATVMLGDSLTYGGKWDEVFPQTRPVTYAVPSEQVNGLLANLDRLLDARPACVFLLAGTNDLGAGTTPAEVSERIGGILDRCRARDTPVVLQSLLPRDAWSLKPKIKNEEMRALLARQPDYHDLIQETNTNLSALADQTDTPYLDLHPLFLDERGGLRRELTNDGTHLTRCGYNRWYRAIGPYLGERPATGIHRFRPARTEVPARKL